MSNIQSRDVDHIVIRFSGDSGDGMQLTGTQFSSTSALMGNDISTFPDFPAEIRAPQGTVAGISGFQVNFGSTTITTPGDQPDVLVAMNPAALKANLDDLKKGGVIILNMDAFTEMNSKKAGFIKDALDEVDLTDYEVIKTPITSQTKTALESLELDIKSKARCKNFYALGMTYYMYSRDISVTETWIAEKFAGKQVLIDANIMALKAGYNFADTLEIIGQRYTIAPAKIEKGTYRQINGNTALSWGVMLGAEKAGINLYLGSYPITPASDILHELAKHKNQGVITFQAEDEMAAVCSAIGASYGGALGLTTSSGPGIALKSEAINLAIIYELPLIVVDVQRGGPSTGLPTKTEQSDLNMAMFGRNGDSPLIIVAPKTPSDCFKMAFEAARLSLEHMTPVIILSDGYLANGSQPWKLPDLDKDFPKINTKFADPANYTEKQYHPYERDENHVRKWAIPGMENLMHRVGGLEKEKITGNVSYDPINHEDMVRIRREKVELASNNIPEQDLFGNAEGELLIVSWGGTYGSTLEAVTRAQANGHSVSLMHMQYLSPMPKNVEIILKGFKKIVVCELNDGQLLPILNAKYGIKATGYNKIQGKPFMIRELTGLIESQIGVVS